jgi:hypothetical protein
MEKNLKEIISTRMDFMKNIINRVGQLEDMGASVTGQWAGERR